MINSVRPYSPAPATNFGRHSVKYSMTQELQGSVDKFNEAATDVLDDKTTGKNLATATGATVVGTGALKIAKGLKLANRGADVANVALKGATNKSKSLMNSPLLKKAKGPASIFGVCLSMLEVFDVVNGVNHHKN